MAESVISVYKTECVRHEGPWRGVDDLELAILNWDCWFNEIRLHGEGAQTMLDLIARMAGEPRVSPGTVVACATLTASIHTLRAPRGRPPNLLRGHSLVGEEG